MLKDRATKKKLHLDSASVLKHMNEPAMERDNPTLLFQPKSELSHGSRLLCQRIIQF